MKIIITENQYRLLKENYEHKRDEIVDFKNINLQYEYDKLNNLLFDNKLPRIQIRWSMTKNSHGHLKIIRNRTTGIVLSIVGMSMSKFYSVPYYVFTNTLAHEMIHVYQAINNITEINNNHGPVFFREASRINNMGLGFNVSEKVNSTQLGSTTSQFVKTKTRIVMVSKFDSIEKIHFMTENAFYDSIDELKQLLNYLTKNKYNEIMGKFYKVNIPNVEIFYINRKISGLTGYLIDSSQRLQSLLPDIMKSENIASIYSTNGETIIYYN